MIIVIKFLYTVQGEISRGGGNILVDINNQSYSLEKNHG